MNINLLVNKYLIVIKPSPFTFSLEYLACAIIKFNILVKPTLASFQKFGTTKLLLTTFNILLKELCILKREKKLDNLQEIFPVIA